MIRPRNLAAALLLVAPLTLVACGDDSDDTTESPSSTVVDESPTVLEPWARASADGQKNGAAYMVIRGGESADRLIAATVSTDIAARAEIHETVMADADGTDSQADGDMGTGGNGMSSNGGDHGSGGAMTMREVEAIEIPAGEEVALEPGGYHVMLMELVEPLVAGDTFDLTLTFENAGDVTVTVEVRTA